MAVESLRKACFSSFVYYYKIKEIYFLSFMTWFWIWWKTYVCEAEYHKYIRWTSDTKTTEHLPNECTWISKIIATLCSKDRILEKKEKQLIADKKKPALSSHRMLQKTSWQRILCYMDKYGNLVYLVMKKIGIWMFQRFLSSYWHDFAVKNIGNVLHKLQEYCVRVYEFSRKCVF